MPNDVVTLNILSKELHNMLIGGKIDRVNQPENTEVDLCIRNQTNTYTLLISVRPNAPRIHITTQKKDNPIVAPNFCMLLRKRLIGARILDISLVNNDRILKISLVGKNEMLDETSYNLYVEIMGSRSNIILADQNNHIISAIKKTELDACNRHIMPGIPYTPPIQNNKISILDTNTLISKLKHAENIYDYLKTNVVGYAMSTLDEIDTTSVDSVKTSIDKMMNFNTYSPCVGICNGNKDFFIYPYKNTSEIQKTQTISQAMDICYSAISDQGYLNDASKNIRNVLKNAIQREDKKLKINENKLIDCDQADIYKLYGELLTTYAYSIKVTTDKVIVNNYYTNEDISIPIDNTKSANHNAQLYYKKYAKLKRTKETVVKLIEENKSNISTYKEYLRQLYCSENIKDIEDIHTLLVGIGLIHTQKKASVQKKSRPITYTIDNCTILVGKNALQNAEITFKLANPKDIWLHVLDYHGSHVIIKGDNISPSIIQIGAELASYYSEAKDNDKVKVDYTEAKYVKKNPTAGIGNVTYSHQHTISVHPKLPN